MLDNKPFFFNIPVFLLGMFFFTAIHLQAQVTLRGQLPDAAGGVVKITTYEGYQSTLVGKVQAGTDGQFLLFFPQLEYEGFFLCEVDAPNGANLLQFPIWLSNSDLSFSGSARSEYKSLTFSDSSNHFFQTQANAINAYHNRLEWMDDGSNLYTEGKLSKALNKQRAAELADLRAAYSRAMATAPNESLQQALTFRFQTDPFLFPFPPYFDAQLLNRIHWKHPQMYRDPLVAEYLTTVFRHYLFHPTNASVALQEKFILDYTWALNQAFEGAEPLRSSVLDLIAEGYQQIEAWDALALMDSLRGKPSVRITQQTQVTWRSEQWNGYPITSQDLDTTSYLLIFWSPLCDHCNKQLPIWSKDRRLLSQVSLPTVGVAMDPDYLQRQTPQPEAAAFDMLLLDKNFPTPDGKAQSISDAFAFSGTPAYFLMAPGNKVAQRFPNWAAVKAYIAQEMKASEGLQKP